MVSTYVKGAGCVSASSINVHTSTHDHGATVEGRSKNVHRELSESAAVTGFASSFVFRALSDLSINWNLKIMTSFIKVDTTFHVLS